MIKKALAVFLSIYIVLLSGMACADEVIHHLSPNTEISQATNDCCPNDADHCSPFCHCQCCHASFQVSGQPFECSEIMTVFIYHENAFHFKSIDLFDFLIPPKA